MSVVEPAEGLRLEQPDEPSTCASDCATPSWGADWRDGFTDDICVGVWLWERWRPALEPAGMDREPFVDVIIGYRRELWLWLAGERLWEQFIVGLAGRVARRLPSA